MEVIFVLGLIFIGALILRFFILGMCDVFEAARIYIAKNTQEIEENEQLDDCGFKV
ncbi:MAG: hypothetical protein JSR85_09005 [Proteobacteria bacterium]|nr:hypothetical protein [Pseudomonadota bacterium]